MRVCLQRWRDVDAHGRHQRALPKRQHLRQYGAPSQTSIPNHTMPYALPCHAYPQITLHTSILYHDMPCLPANNCTCLYTYHAMPVIKSARAFLRLLARTGVISISLSLSLSLP